MIAGVAQAGGMRTDEVRGPSVWTGGAFADRSEWLYEVSDACRNDFERLISSNVPMAGVNAGETSYPHLLSVVRRVGDDVVRGRGFAVLRGFRLERYPHARLKDAFRTIGTWLGTPVPQNRRAETVTEVADLQAERRPSEIRGYQTRDTLPFHCDNCDVVALLCVRKARRGGESALVSSMKIYNRILRERRELLGILYSGYLYDRRGEQQAGDRPFSRRVPVFSYYDGDLSCRYVRGLIETAVAKSGIPLSAMEVEALDTMDALANSPGAALTMTLEPGDIQFCNNHVTLHARTGFDDEKDADKKRLLLRLWINIIGSRRLAPDFMKRYSDDGAWTGISAGDTNHP